MFNSFLYVYRRVSYYSSIYSYSHIIVIVSYIVYSRVAIISPLLNIVVHQP